MSATMVRRVLDDVLADWVPVWSLYKTFTTYRDSTAQWWVVLGMTGDDAGKIRVTRTTEDGRLAEPFDSSIGWVRAEPEDVLELLAAAGAPDVEAAA